MKYNKRLIGADYERRAAESLENKGYRILEYNFRCRLGEIDLIAMDDDCLVFVEVKYRSDFRCGSAIEAVDRKKQSVIRKVAMVYLKKKGLSLDSFCRFDVLGITGENIVHVRNAF